MTEISDPDSVGDTGPSIPPSSARNTPEESGKERHQSATEQVPAGGVPPEGPPPSGGLQSSQSAELAKFTGKVLGGLASQAVVLTAVLFYFGWARVEATYGYFGVDISVLNFSVSDYVLRSVSVAFPILVAIGVVALGTMALHEQLRPGLAGDAESARRLARRAGWAGATLAVAGLVLALALTGPGGSYFWGPALLLTGCTLLAYAFAIRNRYGTPGGFQLLAGITVMVLVAFLWTINAYANYIGIKVAEEFRSSLPTAAQVTVYSSTDLSLSGPGITVTSVHGSQNEYRFRYSGLRMLISSGGHYFLLPSGWRQGHGSVIVLPAAEGGNVRVEFTASAP